MIMDCLGPYMFTILELNIHRFIVLQTIFTIYNIYIYYSYISVEIINTNYNIKQYIRQGIDIVG